jgi:hypothetical protein
MMTMAPSNFRPEVLIWPFPHAQRKVQSNRQLLSNRRNARFLKKIEVEEHDGDVKFWTGSTNTAFLHMGSKNT